MPRDFLSRVLSVSSPLGVSFRSNTGWSLERVLRDFKHRMYVPLRTSRRGCIPQFSRLARRSASTANGSSNPYPYPSKLSPTPHEIFHLPPSASQKEVKSRCVHRPIGHFNRPLICGR